MESAGTFRLLYEWTHGSTEENLQDNTAVLLHLKDPAGDHQKTYGLGGGVNKAFYVQQDEANLQRRSQISSFLSIDLIPDHFHCNPHVHVSQAACGGGGVRLICV